MQIIMLLSLSELLVDRLEQLKPSQVTDFDVGDVRIDYIS